MGQGEWAYSGLGYSIRKLGDQKRDFLIAWKPVTIFSLNWYQLDIALKFAKAWSETQIWFWNQRRGNPGLFSLAWFGLYGGCQRGTAVLIRVCGQIGNYC